MFALEAKIAREGGPLVIAADKQHSVVSLYVCVCVCVISDGREENFWGEGRVSIAASGGALATFLSPDGYDERVDFFLGYIPGVIYIVIRTGFKDASPIPQK